MSKPLELTIHPHDPKRLNTNWLTMYVTPDGPMAAGRSGVLPAAKHLTDAELAAEYWRADGGSLIVAEYSALDGWFNDDGAEYLSWDAADHWRQTIARFTTTPHHFQAAA